MLPPRWCGAWLPLVLCACSWARAAAAPPPSPLGSELQGLELGPDRQRDGWTLSHAFKADLAEHFSRASEASGWTVLEVGSYVGYTTRVLAQLFRRVIVLESSQEFLDRNAARNSDLANVFYLRFHTALDDWSALASNAIDVAVLDAEHDYASVKRDLENILRLASVRLIIFDDWCDPGVRKAVEEFVHEGSLEVLHPMGHSPPWSYKGNVVNYPEGVMCKVRRAGKANVVPAWEGQRFVWYAAAFTRRFGTIHFLKGGWLRASWGKGVWELELGAEEAADRVIARWLDNSTQPRPPGGLYSQLLEFNARGTGFVTRASEADGGDQRFVGVRVDFVKDAIRLSALGLEISMRTKLAQAFQ